MAEHRDASPAVTHRCCKKKTRTGVCARHTHTQVPPSQIERGREAAETLSRKHKEAEDTSRQPLVVFDALVPSDLQTHACESLTKQIQMARGRQGRMDLGTSFRLDALIYPSQFYPTLPTGLPRLANRVSDLP